MIVVLSLASFIAIAYGVNAAVDGNEIRTELRDLAARVLILESRPK